LLSINARLDRARWYAGQNRHLEALQYLKTVPVILDNTDDTRVSYLALTGGYLTCTGTDYAQAERYLRDALELALQMGLPEDLFVWVMRYNLGLTLLLGNRLPQGRYGPVSPTQCERLNEAIGILVTVAEALRAVQNPGYFRESLGGRALAQVAEILYMMNRNEEAASYAREAIPRLQPHNAFAVASRRLFGCYSLLTAIERSRPPGGGLYYNRVPPGTLGPDEADDYVWLPMPYRSEPES
jgi:tetratricopeptide (TPR) repeat protein